MTGNAAKKTPKIDARDDVLALALAKGLTRAEAAGEAGVAERTVYRKIADPAFRALVAGYRKAMINEAFGELARSSGAAFRVLSKLLTNPDPAVQLRAAWVIGRLLVNVGKYSDIDDRLTEIESRLDANGGMPEGRHTRGDDR